MCVFKTKKDGDDQRFSGRWRSGARISMVILVYTLYTQFVPQVRCVLFWSDAFCLKFKTWFQVGSIEISIIRPIIAALIRKTNWKITVEMTYTSWFFDKIDFKRTPSVLDGISIETEQRYRREGKQTRITNFKIHFRKLIRFLLNLHALQVPDS